MFAILLAFVSSEEFEKQYAKRPRVKIISNTINQPRMPKLPQGFDFNILKEQGCNACMNLAQNLINNPDLLDATSKTVCFGISNIPKIGGFLEKFCKFFDGNVLKKLIVEIDKNCAVFDCCKKIGIC